jgi:hypothetical protein
LEVAAMVQRTNRNQMRSKKNHGVGSTTENSSEQAPPPVHNTEQTNKPTGGSSRNPKGMNWDKIKAKAKEKRAESRMTVEYEEVRCYPNFQN